MFGVLIESRAGKQRRAGGAMASVVLHGVMIGGAVVLTATTATSTQPDKPQVVETHYLTKLPEPTPSPRVDVPSGPKQFFVPEDRFVVRAPVSVPTTIPSFDPTARFDPSKVEIVGSGPITRNPHDTVSKSFAPGDVFSSEMVERIAALVDSPRPQYPETLRLAGVSGRVVVRFVVDTTGRVERESVHVVESSHARFENSVRDILPRMRFRAAMLNDAKVRMLVEMPFEFSIERK